MKPQASELDIKIGLRLKEIRKAHRLSQNDLAKVAGVSFQQIQKYEIGANRISASRLYIISTALGINMDAFFEDLCSDQKTSKPTCPELSSILHNWSKIKDQGTKEAISYLVQTRVSESGQ